MKHLKLWLATILLTGCDFGMTGDDAVRQTAVSWAEAYFNCDFHEAEKYVTPESIKWLRFAASNVTEQELQLLNENNATVEAWDGFTIANDTICIVTLSVKNNLTNTPLRESPKLSEEDTFTVTVVKRDNQWRVRMEGLPRSEKRSLDSDEDE